MEPLHNTLNKFASLYAKSGFLLFLLRLPIRSFKVLRNQANTLYWRFFIGKVGKDLFIEYGVSIGNPKKITIGDNVYIGSGTQFGSETLDGTLVLHNNTHIGRNCSIDHSGEVILKENVLLSEGVKIFSHSHGYNPRSKPTSEKLVICENSWIGNDAMILEKAKFIASGVIVGAGSLVTKSCVKKNSIYAGAPALFKKYIP